MLITCPDCSKQISDAAPACPGCGRPLHADRGADAAGEERTILEDPAVKVTTKRVTFSSGAMLPTAQITSVQPFVDRGFNFGLGAAPLLMVLGLYFALRGTIGEGNIGRSAAQTSLAVGVASLLLALIAIPLGSRLRATRHWVTVTSGGTTTRGVFSKDPAWTAGVVKAIGEAISTR